MKHLNLPITAASLLLGGAILATVLPHGSAQAAVDPAIVPADARWIVYADFNALRTTTLGKEFVAIAAQVQSHSPVGVNVDKVLATVGSITAYGSNFTADPKALDGTLILQGTEDLRKIAESLVLQAMIASPETISESKDFQFPAYAITAPKQQDGSAGPGLIVAFPPEPMVVISKSKAQVLKARELLRGNAGSIARTSNAPLKGLLHISDNAYLFAASMVPPEAQVDGNAPQARVLRMTNSGAIALGEQGPNTIAHAELIASSDDMADKAMKIVQGMAAMLSLAETNDKQLTEFMNSVAVNRNGRAVTLDLSYSSERLAQMVRSLREREPRPGPARPQGESIVRGKSVAEWKAEAKQGADPEAPAERMTHSVDNIELRNGMVITLGRRLNGGKPVRFESVEIIPAAGGTPMSFRSEFMRQIGPTMNQFQFPGLDGTYTLKVTYQNDPTGKAHYVVSVREVTGSAPDGTGKSGGSSR